VRVRSGDPAEAETVASGLRRGEDSPLPGARARRGHIAADGNRLVVGVGEGTPEDVRVASAAVVRRTREMGSRSLGWEGPQPGAFVEGALLAGYRFTAFKSAVSEPGLEELVVAEGAEAAAGAEAANAARDLQNAPGNALTPTALAGRAQELGLECEVWGRAEMEGAGMGAFAGVAKGSDEEPALITLRYDGHPGPGSPTLGLVGKAVTFDAGGISIKSAKTMSEMKFDMSGGAVVLEATAAIARLGLPIRLVSVIGATENLLSGSAMKPGDIVRARSGTTIEVINTDAEGRLVLADCLAHAIEQGAERLVDVATLTGAIITTFGRGHAGLMGNDDGWCEVVRAAGERTGERVWRLPLDPYYEEALESRYADIVNAVENRHAASIFSAQFLARFVGEVPWAHLDIAGVAHDNGRAYTRKGGSGWGVRLLIEVARMVSR
jgi:leucyl aminopeptidase